MIQNWDTVAVGKSEDYYIFDILRVSRKNPNNGEVSDFVVIDSKPWVNIIPLTSDKNVIFVKQFRHGLNDATIEIPGGLVEHGESSVEAAVRECIEETGYSSDEQPELLGVSEANPAFMNNVCSSYLWRNCRKNTVQKFDIHEDIQIIEIPLADIPSMILSGSIRHSLVLAAFNFYYLSNEMFAAQARQK